MQPSMGSALQIVRMLHPRLAFTGVLARLHAAGRRPDVMEQAMVEERVPLTVHGMSVSGNCHKVRLLLEQLGSRYRWVEVDSAHGQTHTPEFLALNPNAKVPLIVRDDGRVLTESNAILFWLAEGRRTCPLMAGSARRR